QQTIIQGPDSTGTTNYNGSGQPLATGIVYVSGNTDDITYSTDPADSWFSQSTFTNQADEIFGTSQINKDGSSQGTAVDPTTGNPVLEASVNADGSYTLQYFDPITRNFVYSQQFDHTGKLVSETPPPSGFSIGQFAGVVANALAAQAI